MHKIDEKSFTVIANTSKQAFDILLRLSNYDKASFSTYMGVDIETLEEPPQWAFKYLQDLINADLIHLGYIMKDTKTAGIMFDYNETQKTITQLVGQSQLTGNQPVTIKSSIITEDGSIKAKYLVYAEEILLDFISTATPE